MKIFHCPYCNLRDQMKIDPNVIYINQYNEEIKCICAKLAEIFNEAWTGKNRVDN